MKAPVGLHLRNETINGLGPWLWRAEDYWAWKHPLTEWPALRDLILGFAPQRRVIVQAGGCMGMYPRLWAEHFATVYTFEPDAVNFYCLTANCADAGIIKMQAALTDSAGVYAFEPGPDFNPGLGKVSDAPNGTIIGIPLDALRLPVVDVLQLDCEGGELVAIRGATHTILTLRPLIAIEKPDHELRIMLDSLGYAEVGRAGTMPDVVFEARATR